MGGEMFSSLKGPEASQVLRLGDVSLFKRDPMGHVRNYTMGDVVARFKRAADLMFQFKAGMLECPQKMPGTRCPPC